LGHKKAAVGCQICNFEVFLTNPWRVIGYENCGGVIWEVSFMFAMACLYGEIEKRKLEEFV
jgi:hypothetical protein